MAMKKKKLNYLTGGVTRNSVNAITKPSAKSKTRAMKPKTNQKEQITMKNEQTTTKTTANNDNRNAQDKMLKERKQMLKDRLMNGDGMEERVKFIKASEIAQKYRNNFSLVEKLGVETLVNEVVLPNKLMAEELKKRQHVSLAEYINFVEVPQLKGEYYTALSDNETMPKFTETLENSDFSITKVEYDCDVFVGNLPVSVESLEDKTLDYENVTLNFVSRKVNLTRNKEIALKLQQAPTKSISNFEGLKDVINLDIAKLSPIIQLVVSSSLFNIMDKSFDEKGNKILDVDATSPSGKSFSGRHVIVLQDDVIGTKDGDLVAFVGDLFQYIAMFDMNKTSFEWVNYHTYTTSLRFATRFDTQITNSNYGRYITYQTA